MSWSREYLTRSHVDPCVSKTSYNWCPLHPWTLFRCMCWGSRFLRGSLVVCVCSHLFFYCNSSIQNTLSLFQISSILYTLVGSYPGSRQRTYPHPVCFSTLGTFGRHQVSELEGVSSYAPGLWRGIRKLNWNSGWTSNRVISFTPVVFDLHGMGWRVVRKGPVSTPSKFIRYTSVKRTRGCPRVFRYEWRWI